MSLRSIATALALVATLLPGAAQAVFRAYVAPDGSDLNPCTLVQPCRLLPAALAAVDSGGEIWMLDSANYNTGEVNVAKSVTILAVPGALGSVVAAGGSAIVINTPGIDVVLRNLVIVPLGGGGIGINTFNVGGTTLTLESCLVANLSHGIVAEGGLTLRIDRSTVRGNAGTGVGVYNGASATITNSLISRNGPGIRANNESGGTTSVNVSASTLEANEMGLDVFGVGGITRGSLTRSQVVGNNYGVLVRTTGVGGVATAVVSGNVVSNNTVAGIATELAGAKVYATRNTVTDNEVGFQQAASLFETACDNALRNNVLDSSGAITPADCPAPKVLSASATSATSVNVVFDRTLAPSSVLANGSQFVFDNGLSATAASASGKVATVTTTTQSPASPYVVTVATTVTDKFGTALSAAANSAAFVSGP